MDLSLWSVCCYGGFLSVEASQEVLVFFQILNAYIMVIRQIFIVSLLLQSSRVLRHSLHHRSKIELPCFSYTFLLAGCFTLLKRFCIGLIPDPSFITFYFILTCLTIFIFTLLTIDLGLFWNLLHNSLLISRWNLFSHNFLHIPLF